MMGVVPLRWPSLLGKPRHETRKESDTSARQQAPSFMPIQNPGIESEQNQNVRKRLSRWKWEIMGMVLSLLSFSASVVLLAVFNGQRVDSWTAPFTLNTFISILAQTSRTSLAFGVGSSLGQAKWNTFTTRHGNLALFEAFDEASKGPWGSLSLMYHLRSW